MRGTRRVNTNKTAELSQRIPRDAPNIWVPWKFLRVLTTHPATFPEICNGLLFRSILRMCVQKFEVRSFTRSWDNRLHSKNLGSPWIRPRSIFSQNFKGLLFGFLFLFWIYLPNLKFVALSVPEIIGVLKKFGQSLHMPTLPFLPNFYLAFLRMDPLNISAKFDVRSFTRSWHNRGGTQKIWGSPWIRPRSISPKILKGFCSDGPCEYACQIWSS